MTWLWRYWPWRCWWLLHGFPLWHSHVLVLAR